MKPKNRLSVDSLHCTNISFYWSSEKAKDSLLGVHQVLALTLWKEVDCVSYPSLSNLSEGGNHSLLVLWE